MLTRRRLIAISAAMAASSWAGIAQARSTTRLWTGQALGARASIRLDHPQAEAIAARVVAEIDRLEDILPLYRANRALRRLNRNGRLDSPPFELLECLSAAGAVHAASGGRFDPTVQPLWRLWAEAAAVGKKPTDAAIERARLHVGWEKVTVSPAAIVMKPGMSLTLNGIGQGYVTDRVAALLEAEGLTAAIGLCCWRRARGWVCASGRLRPLPPWGRLSIRPAMTDTFSTPRRAGRFARSGGQCRFRPRRPRSRTHCPRPRA